jgi:hypothetical protein
MNTDAGAIGDVAELQANVQKGVERIHENQDYADGYRNGPSASAASSQWIHVFDIGKRALEVALALRDVPTRDQIQQVEQHSNNLAAQVQGQVPSLLLAPNVSELALQLRELNIGAPNRWGWIEIDARMVEVASKLALAASGAMGTSLASVPHGVALRVKVDLGFGLSLGFLFLTEPNGKRVNAFFLSYGVLGLGIMGSVEYFWCLGHTEVRAIYDRKHLGMIFSLAVVGGVIFNSSNSFASLGVAAGVHAGASLSITHVWPL